MARGRRAGLAQARGRRRLVFSVVGAVTLLVVAGLAVLTVQRTRAQGAEARQLTAENAAEAASAVSTARASESAAAQSSEAARVAGLLPVSWPRDRPLRVMLTGDSVSAGWHASVQANSYAELVRGALQQHGQVDFIGRYWAGAKASDVLAAVGPRAGVDLSIVELGLNDQFKGTRYDDFRATYNAYLDRVRGASPGAALLCLGLWSPHDAKYGPYDDVVEQSCLAHGGKYLDLSPTFNLLGTHGPAGKRDWIGTTDTIHPNDTGMRMIARLVLERVPNLVPAS